MRQKLAIVHVTRSPVGGIFRHISDLATAQAEAGHAVGLICDSVSGGLLEEERIGALSKRLSLGVTRIRMARSIGPGDFPVLLSVERTMAKLRPDVVHCHGAKGGVYCRIAAAFERRKGRGVAAFYAPHGGSLHYDGTTRSGRVYFAVERALERLTDGLIHVSAFEAETYRRKVGAPRCPAHVVLNGLRPEEFSLVAPAHDAADFLMIGELRDLKGVDVFIEAIGKLQGEGFPARAVIVGPGTEEDRLRYRRMADEAVRGAPIVFLPPMPARKAFALARTIVLPSRAESLPYVVLEAAGAAMPIIATNVGGIPEIFSGETERLVPPGDADALAAAMRGAMTSLRSVAAEAMQRRGRIKLRFSSPAMFGRTEEIYRNALAARASARPVGSAVEAGAPR